MLLPALSGQGPPLRVRGQPPGDRGSDLTILLPPGATAGLTRKAVPPSGSWDKPSGGTSRRANAPGAHRKHPFGCWRFVVAAAGFITAAVLILMVVIPYAGSPPVPAAAPSAAQGPDLTCAPPERYGTRVEFARTPTEAAQRAHRDRKLTFLLHISGNFEEPGFTWNNAEALRGNALADAGVGKYLNTHFVSSFQKVGTFRIAGGRKQGGNVAGYFCTPDGQVLQVVAGPVNAPVLLREARWVVETWKLALLERQEGPALQAFFGKAHAQRLRYEHGLRLSEPLPLGDEPPPAVLAGMLEQPGSKALSIPGRVHLLLATAPLLTVEQLYQVVFERILAEEISTNPVEVAGMPWINFGICRYATVLFTLLFSSM